MINNFSIEPTYQVLCEKRELDKTKKFVEVTKVKQYNYRPKIQSKELKVSFNRHKLLLFNEISMKSGKSILPIMNLIIDNKNIKNKLVYKRIDITVSYLVKKYNISQPTISRYFKKLQDADLLKRYKRNYYLSPYAFYPNINELKLRVLQLWWDSDFKEDYEKINRELERELERVKEEAMSFTGVEKKEFEKLKQVKELNNKL